jgi:hypothetical protein
LYNVSYAQKESLRSQFLLVRKSINFNERSPSMFSISLNKPYAYYEEDFKKLIKTSSQLLGKHHQISKKLQRLYKKIGDYWYTNSNYYANNLDARYAEEDAIESLFNKVVMLIQEL